jgi:hypothetical protein
MAAKPPVPVSDVKYVGNPDTFQLLCKASSEIEGWMKTTKAMLITSGCLIQTTSQQRNPDGSFTIAESLCFIRDVRIDADVNGGKKLVVSK